jgi:hypothetical protein
VDLETNGLLRSEDCDAEAATWHEQHLADLQALHELAHARPGQSGALFVEHCREVPCIRLRKALDHREDRDGEPE